MLEIVLDLLYKKQQVQTIFCKMQSLRHFWEKTTHTSERQTFFVLEQTQSTSLTIVFFIIWNRGELSCTLPKVD